MGFILKTWTALPPLLVATAAAGLAAAWFWWTPWLLVPVVIVTLLVGTLLYYGGWGLVRSRPKTAIALMEWWILVPLTLVAIVGALAIGLAVLFEPGTNWSVEQKKVVGAIGGAIAAFLAATWTKSAEEVDTKWLVGRIQKAFEEKYSGVFKSESAGELAVYSGIAFGDWAYDDRRERANAIADALQDPEQLASS